MTLPSTLYIPALTADAARLYASYIWGGALDCMPEYLCPVACQGWIDGQHQAGFRVMSVTRLIGADGRIAVVQARLMPAIAKTGMVAASFAVMVVATGVASLWEGLV